MPDEINWRWVQAVWDLGFTFVRMMDDRPDLKELFEELDPEVRQKAEEYQRQKAGP